MTALTVDRFRRLMADILPEPPARLAIAVSGGADSMALALLAARWAQEAHVSLDALTVDHRLRPESTTEAEGVAAWMRTLGLPHHVLTWGHDAPPGNNRQANARDARYTLMAAWCARHGVRHLLLAHHQDDQAETFLIRLQRGSGIDGLSAIRPVSQRDSLTLLRPLLPIPKSQLVATLEQAGQPWVEDPSNDDPHYTRTRIRHALSALGLEATTLAATAQHMARARDYLEQQTAQAAATCLHRHDDGFLTLDHTAFTALHEEIALRLLADTLRLMNGDIYRPRFHELHGLYTALPDTRTLAGCLFSRQRDGQLRIEREPAAIAPQQPVAAGTRGIWDGRFHYAIGAGCPDNAQLGALGAEGWACLAARAPETALSRDLPKRLLHSLPALWHLESPVLVPHIGYKRENADTAWLEIRAFRAPNGS